LHPDGGASAPPCQSSFACTLPTCPAPAHQNTHAQLHAPVAELVQRTLHQGTQQVPSPEIAKPLVCPVRYRAREGCDCLAWPAEGERRVHPPLQTCDCNTSPGTVACETRFHDHAASAGTPVHHSVVSAAGRSPIWGWCGPGRRPRRTLLQLHRRPCTVGCHGAAACARQRRARPGLQGLLRAHVSRAAAAMRRPACLTRPRAAQPAVGCCCRCCCPSALPPRGCCCSCLLMSAASPSCS
jgi:hypothetical protein